MDLLAPKAVADSHKKSPGAEFKAKVTYVGPERGPPSEKHLLSDTALPGFISCGAYLFDECTSTFIADKPRCYPSDAPANTLIKQPTRRK